MSMYVQSHKQILVKYISRSETEYAVKLKGTNSESIFLLMEIILGFIELCFGEKQVYVSRWRPQ